MNDRPILFSAPMVRALLEGRKTQTRRVLKQQPLADDYYDGQIDCTFVPARDARDSACFRFGASAVGGGAIRTEIYKPPYAPGVRLWVKEGWNSFAFSEDGEEAWPTKTIPTADEMAEIREAAYRVDVQAVYRESDRARKWFTDQKWRPSIHMPRWASRLTLTVTDVRVQRLQDISEDDARAEGVGTDTVLELDVGDMPAVRSVWNGVACSSHVDAMRETWAGIHGAGEWAANPWVCAVSFSVHKCNIDQVGVAL